MADQGNGMQRYDDSEPLFGEEVYQLLRDDSLLHRTGSNNFAALIDSSDSLHYHDDTQLQPLAFPQAVTSQVVSGTGTPGLILSPPSQPHEQQHYTSQQPTELHWDRITDNDDIKIPSSLGQFVQQEPLGSMLESGSSYTLPDTTPTHTVPSLQPWPGRFLFSIRVPTDNKDRNKWCYSQSLQKLYVCPNVAVPVNVSLGEWADAKITITPVFKESRCRLEPVTRCYNCKSSQVSEGESALAEHIIQLDGEGCEYSCVNERHIVTVPLQPPPPGENVSTLFMKSMCLTSCVGGPNRKPFNVVFTLRSTVTGLEVGRQVLDVKCCKCPSRDMANEEHNQNKRVGMVTLDDEKQIKVRKLASEIVVGQKRKRPNIKLEPGTELRTVKIDCPEVFETQVKQYINYLSVARVLKHTQPSLFLYPDVI